MRTRFVSAGIALMASIALAGCTVDGDAVEDPAAVIDVAALDTGDYPTEPREAFGTTSEDDVLQTEGQRMAEFTALAGEVDPSLVHKGPSQTIRSRNNLSPVLGEAFAGALTRIVAGFQTEDRSSQADDENQKSLQHGFWRFFDAKDAVDNSRKAMDAFVKDAKYPPLKFGKIDGMPGTIVARGEQDGKHYTYAMTPRGVYAMFSLAISTDPAWNDQVTKKNVELQAPLTDRFPRTLHKDERGNRPGNPVQLDQNKILIYTLPIPDNELSGQLGLGRAVYGPRGYGNLSDNGVNVMKTLEETESPHVGFERSDVFRAGDDQKAGELMDSLVRSRKQVGFTEQPAPKGLPTAKCLNQVEAQGELDSCFVQVGRYVGYVSSRSGLADAHQQISAQYVILTKADQEAN